jgi:hypothetical protein
MTAFTLEHDSSGTFSGSGARANSVTCGSITTTGADQLVLIAVVTGRENTSTDYQETTDITGTSYTWSRVFSQDLQWTDTPADPSFPLASMHIDVFAAIVPTTTSSQSWDSTISGDGFVNNGAAFVLTVDGSDTSGTVADAFDANASNIKWASQTTGAASSPGVTGFSTDTTDPFLVSLILQHKAGGSAPNTITGPTGTTGIGELNVAGASASRFKVNVFTEETTQQSSASITAGSTDDMWGMLEMALTPSGGGGGSPPSAGAQPLIIIMQ